MNSFFNTKSGTAVFAVILHCRDFVFHVAEPSHQNQIQKSRMQKTHLLKSALDCCSWLSICSLIHTTGAIASDGKPVSFRNDVATILLENCIACHGPKKAEGGYRLDTFDELSKAGDSGIQPISNDAKNTGELFRRIISTDKTERMPAEADPLPQAQIDTIKRWLAEGANFDGDKSNATLNLVTPPKTYPDPPTKYAAPVPITAMAFSGDGSQLLVGGYHEVTVWNTADGALARRIKNVGQRVYKIAFLADQKTIAVGCGEPGRNGEVRLIDFESGQIRGVVGRSNDVVLDIAVRPETAITDPAKPAATAKHEIAIASADGIIRIVDTDTMLETRTIANHADWVIAVAWSDDGTKLGSASRDKSAKVFNETNGELVVSYPGHGAPVRGITFLPDGKQMASAGTDNKLHRWEIDGAKKVAEVALGGEGYKIIRNDNAIIVPSSDKQLRVIQLSDNKVTMALGGYQEWVVSSAYHAGTNRLAGGALDGEVRVWNAADGTLLRNWVAKP